MAISPNKTFGMLSGRAYDQLAQKMAVSPNRSVVCAALNLCTSNITQSAATQILHLSPEELVAISRDANGSKYVVYERCRKQCSLFKNFVIFFT